MAKRARSSARGPLTSKEICNTGECTEGIFALSASGRTEVDELVKTAIGAGRTHALPTTDYGFSTAILTATTGR
jgi:predicted lactoylglutathione lyase